MAGRIWVALFCLAIEARAAELSGRVIDAEQALPLTGAFLSLPDASRSVLTDPQGGYRITDLEPGMYRVVARHVGYATQVFQALVPETGAVEITVALRPESIPLEGIEVHGQVPLRSLDPASGVLFPERGLSAAEVRHHPLLSEPDLLQALGGGEVRVDPEAPTGLSVRGGASDQIAYLVDGIPIRNPQHAGGTFSALNPDVVARIDLRSVAPRAEDPSAASGVVAVETHEPGAEPRVRGAASNTQARIAVDGPLGRVGMLLGARVTFPGLVPRKSAATYLRGEGADWLAKFALLIARGKLRLLSYGNEDEVSVALSNPEFNGGVQPGRNLLAWDGNSHGLIWSRTAGSSSLSLRAWAARSDASAHWTGADSLTQRLVTSSREIGLGGQYETVRGGHDPGGWTDRGGRGAAIAA
ncbi:MAG: carboxypeptidase regulatory-like domain-containing protein [Candidatus Eisenbacteria bacterium]|nr:carboxypeptidase regulatory-like domain-containing protein [Candidatus Eisenbacteria bacterium]